MSGAGAGRDALLTDQSWLGGHSRRRYALSLLRTSPVANALPGPIFCASRQAQQLFDHALSRLVADLSLLT
ncbi:hypothetical protein [Xanthomonas arboricola]|uniref:hypothetical protein n=1 Tax=Xanthomonas arboricola TaxID=56448 RepID=UPI00128FDBA1|nr:hypothetical protein [Xanthomonas arboricola]